MKRLFLFVFFIFWIGFVFAVDSSQKIYSSSEALAAINQSEEILNEFISLELPYSTINDSLIEAQNVYLQAYYAEILRGNINSSLEERVLARDALQLVNWKNLGYSDVIVFTNKIQEIRFQTLNLYDLLKLAEKKISEKISNETMNYFLLARDSFYQGRLNETKTYLDQFTLSYESEYGSSSFFKSLTLQTKNFFYRYWIQIVIFLIVLAFFVYFAYVKFRLYYLKRTVQKLFSEKNTLFELTKKAQVERFKEYKISSLTYNIRIKSYQERLQKINSILPVLQARLKKLSKI